MKYKIACEYLVPKTSDGNPSVSFNTYDINENLYHSNTRPLYHMEMYIDNYKKSIVTKFKDATVYHNIPINMHTISNAINPDLIKDIMVDELYSYLYRIRKMNTNDEIIIDGGKDSINCFNNFVARSVEFLRKD